MNLREGHGTTLEPTIKYLLDSSQFFLAHAALNS